MDVPYFTLVDGASGERLGLIVAAQGDTLYAAATRAGIGVRTTCRASAICGLCWVDVLEADAPLEPAAPDEQALLDRFAEGTHPRLACRLRFPADGSMVTVAASGWTTPW